MVNLAGVQQPIAPVDMAIDYRPPPGMRMVAADVATPDQHGQTGAALVARQQDGFFRIGVRVDQFALIEVVLARVGDVGARAVPKRAAQRPRAGPP